MEHNFRKQRSTSVYSFGVGYDYGSIMHYGSTAFSRNGQPTITAKRRGVTLGQRRGLSASDVKQVQLLYGCTTTKPTGITKSICLRVCAAVVASGNLYRRITQIVSRAKHR